MSESGEVVSVNLSREKGTTKHPVDKVEVNDEGIIGDAHAGPWHRQVSLLDEYSIQHFSAELGRQIAPGEFAENITLRGVDLGQARLLDRFRINDVDLELTQIGKKCHGDNCAIFREVGKCVMPKEGLFCRVLSGGTIEAGDPVVFKPRIWRFLVVTLSDRAHRGEYEDLSGPRVVKHLEEFAGRNGLRCEIESDILPDDEVELRHRLEVARDSAVDVIFTSGGTGVGPRDITPEVVSGFCDKIIPGIMEVIRVKYGSDKPNAQLSRSVAGVADSVLVYALPGSLKAVDEYMQEIVKTLQHTIHMIYQIDAH